MNHRKMQTLAFIASIALAATAFAQGRHDEKPHGQHKPAQTAMDGETRGTPMAGGRHDERPHGQTKPVTKKDATGKKMGETKKHEMMKNDGDMGKGMK